jgi:hypothetical protein
VYLPNCVPHVARRLHKPAALPRLGDDFPMTVPSTQAKELSYQEESMSVSTARANKIAAVIIPVADQDGAIDFYVTKLGFEKRVDVPFGNGYRAGLRSRSVTSRPRSPSPPRHTRVPSTIGKLG